MISVAIVDDHPIVRAGLKTVLGSTADIQVTAEGVCGVDAIRIVEEGSPDVLILDLNLPDFNGLEVARRLHCDDRAVSTAILVLTVHCEDPLVFSALQNGILGYVLKDEALETLATAVRAVARGENWLSPSIATKVIHHTFNQVTQPDKKNEGNALNELTPRELEVLKLIALGLDNQAIADHLVVTKRTVQNHVSNIYSRLGVNNRMEAAFLAIRHGLVQPFEAKG